MPTNGTAPVALLDWELEPIRVVQDAEWVLDDRDDSTNELRVTTTLEQADGVNSEQELIFKGRRFGIRKVHRDRVADRAVITADEVQAELAELKLVDYRPDNWTLNRAIDEAVSGTRWTRGETTGIREGRADFDEITALDALHFLARHQDAQLWFDSLRRRINITGTRGTDHEYVFTYGRQLENIEKVERKPVTTVIYPTMADDVALDPVEDYGYYHSRGLSIAEARARFRKEDHWADNDYEFAANMQRDAAARLAVEAYPQITYTLTAAATKPIDGQDDFDLAELQLGDRVYVWDNDIDARLRAEVTAVTTSSDASENRLVLSYLPPSLSTGTNRGSSSATLVAHLMAAVAAPARSRAPPCRFSRRWAPTGSP
ncbi:phage tail protein [Nesterenkonia pannonica]|uniref:phage tail protein n=1 Tax=Nesterenkonia pannonica TaxID=1548602 RepID=UPI002164745E|nr:phage tail protein [Nesterenkonia pannonica]